jgi:hypothetical protein
LGKYKLCDNNHSGFERNNVFYRNSNDKELELFGPTIRTRWNVQNKNLKDELISHMVKLFGNIFNKNVVTQLAGESLKYTRSQYRQRLEENLKYEHPPMVLEKEWKALIEDAKDNFLKRQGKQPRPGKAMYDTYHIFSEICSIFFFK